MKKVIFLNILLVSFMYSKTLVFGVVPQQSPQKMFKAWQPFIQYLSTETGIEIIFKTEKSIPEFESKLYSGAYDIAYSNPYHYTIAHKSQNHNAIARFNKMIVGILIVKKDSTINTLNDIKGKDFLFPAPKAFAATILTKYDLLNKKKYDVDKSDKLRYVNSHDSVYLGIQRGIGDIGGGIMRTFNKFKYKDDLKIIYKTDKYPSHPISISTKVDSKTINKIKNVLLNMPKEYTKLINKKYLIKTINSEYEIVKKLAQDLSIFPN